MLMLLMLMLMLMLLLGGVRLLAELVAVHEGVPLLLGKRLGLLLELVLVLHEWRRCLVERVLLLLLLLRRHLHVGTICMRDGEREKKYKCTR